MSSELISHLVIDTNDVGTASEAACGTKGSFYWSWEAAYTTCKRCKKTKWYTTASVVEDSSDSTHWMYPWVRYLISIGRCKHYKQYEVL